MRAPVDLTLITFVHSINNELMLLRCILWRVHDGFSLIYSAVTPAVPNEKKLTKKTYFKVIFYTNFSSTGLKFFNQSLL